MSDIPETGESPGTVLCKACGLCCTGHLFAWVKLRSPEVDSAQALGLSVLGTDPRQRGFNQPCPLWNGVCTIYTSPHYPRSCKTYKCKLLKKVLDGSSALPEALTVLQQAKQMIHELEPLLPASSNRNFRERMVAHLEDLQGLTTLEDTNLEFQYKVDTLLSFYKEQFGVKDLVDNPDGI